MSSPLLNVSLSPHVYTEQTVKNVMWRVVIALQPALLMSVYVFGIHAMEVTVFAAVSCVFFEYVIQKFVLKVKPTVEDGSALVTGLLLAFTLPPNLPPWMVIIGSFVAVAVGKLSFGGLGNNPFNPALVGRVFLLFSFPVAMTSWPTPFGYIEGIDTLTAATPLSVLKQSLTSGQTLLRTAESIPSHLDMMVGRMSGSLGEISDIALLVGGLYMIKKKIITWHIPVSMIGSMVLLTGILWFIKPGFYGDPLFHLLTGGVMLGAIFMATDPATSPMTSKGMLIFGFGIGAITVMIRIFGAFPEGVSFAILIMNAFVPLINRYCKPKRFGEGS